MSDETAGRLQRARPCPECPWRRDVPVGKFPPDRYRALAGSCGQTMEPMFACHKSVEGDEIACAGMLAVAGATSIRVRLGIAAGAINMAAVSAAVSEADFPPLYGSFAEMAVANGVPADDEQLADDDLWTGRGPVAAC